MQKDSLRWFSSFAMRSDEMMPLRVGGAGKLLNRRLLPRVALSRCSIGLEG